MRSKHDENKKLCSRKLKLCFLIPILCSINIILSFKNIDFASAVSYQSSTNVQFTFNPTLSMSVSGDLIIDSLAPGSSSDSNIITVSINTNSAYGYQLSATVGTKTEGEDALVNGNNEFTNLTSNVSSLSNFSDNSWGYSYSTDSGTNWISGNVGSSSSGYNGLPLDNNNDDTNLLGYGGVTLIDTNTLSNNNSIQFKIGAKASTTQPAGTYTNTVNFYAITYAPPMNLAESYAAAGATQTNGYYRLQDMTSSICEAADVYDEGSAMQVIDTRDNKIYWITKLHDEHCWMTQNLDLDLETTPTSVAALTSNNTDLNQFGSNGYTTDYGYSCSNPSTTTNCTADGEVITWKPTNTTRNYATSTGTAWSDNYDVAYSMDTGDWYYAGHNGTTLLPSVATNYLTITPDANGDIINSSNSNVYFSNNPSRVNGGTHEHVGNYYNWSAAVASNSTSSYQNSTYANIANNPQNSICPAGWRLPTITSASPTYSSAGSRNEFARLVYLYNNNSYVTNSSAKLELAPLFFARGGYVLGGSLYYSGSYGHYWSSTVYSRSGAYHLYFGATDVRPTYNSNCVSGFSVRCVAR